MAVPYRGRRGVLGRPVKPGDDNEGDMQGMPPLTKKFCGTTPCKGNGRGHARAKNKFLRNNPMHVSVKRNPPDIPSM